MWVRWLAFFAVCTTAWARLTCSEFVQERKPEFHLVAPCSASGMSVVARTNTSSLKRCSQFAGLKRGLAFDFILPGKRRTTPENCMVYDCPEFDTLQSVRRERGYNYYSLYANPLPSENTTCVTGVGIFRLFEKRANYTEAIEICRAEGGELANILTDVRTNGLSNMVSNLNGGRKALKLAYVGMDDIEHENRFMTLSGKLLSCFEYRAWAPGEPRNVTGNEDCVVINDRRNWRVVPCSRRLPFICEILPRGPFPIPDDDKVDRCRIDLSNRQLHNTGVKDKKFYKKLLIFQWIS